jgi:hypothetical protein
MSTKHPKQKKPSDVDLDRNPLIGGSKGMTMAQATADDLEELEGVNTFEGDVDNDTNPEGGIEDVTPRRTAARRRDRRNHTPGPRHPVLQGRKTHEQQLRMLERKADMPDERQIERELEDLPKPTAPRVPRPHVRQSEFPVSRGGMNQESQHNKHNHQTQSGHKPQKPRAPETGA